VGNLSFNFQLGAQLSRLSQNFDTVKPPALPTNWQTTATGNAGWVTSAGVFNTPTNSAFIADPIGISDASLISPPFTISSTNAQLSFSHRYDTEYGFDGGVLEISINNGPFTDILAAGAAFGANGYNYFIDESFGNPLAGREAWTGDSANFLTTTVTMPSSLAGKSARLRWRLASDSDVAATGWYVDSILVTERGCNYPAILPLIVNTRRQGTNVVFSFNTRAGVYYAVEYKNSFTDTGWTPLMVQSGDGTTRSVTNNISASQRFYRLREL
ncbi:MAG TPA: hypothetical protein VK530_13245, partial [Candidatus Acidoferrum sp.]|nr:hypothetical protein [Candidatus Acidoferrum sp.]